MSKALTIGIGTGSHAFTIPIEAVTETFAILAKRGVGKTYTAAVLVEELLKADQQVIVIDPLDVWWGLQASADGQHPGLPIAVFGGAHANLPLDASAGAVFADLVVEERIAAVFSVRHLSKTKQRQFVTEFCERIYERKGEPAHQQPLHIVIDEADAFAPQRVPAGQERMLGAVDDLVRRGRSSGIGVTVITQRAAVIHKDVLTQIEVLIALRTLSPQDRKAVEDWIEAHDAQGQKAEFMASLASLPIGTAWFWSPGWLDVFQRINVRRRETFDSSATPRPGMTIAPPKTLADINVAALEQRLAATIEQAEANDPRTLRQRIVELEQQLKTVPAAQPVPAVERIVEVPAVSGDDLNRLVSLVEQLRAQSVEAAAIAERIEQALARVAEPGGAAPAATVVPVPAPAPARAAPADLPAAGASHGHGQAGHVSDTDLDGNVKLSNPQRAILNALAAFERVGMHHVARSNLAVWSGQSPTSSGYSNNLSTLRSAGFIDYPSGGMVSLTDPGRNAARPTTVISSRRQLHQAWYERLSGPQRKILQVVVERYPKQVSRDELANEADQSPTSSGYSNNLSVLRSLDLIDYPGPKQVVATGLLFPAGLPA